MCVHHQDELITRYNEKTKEFKCTRCVVNEDTGKEEVKGGEKLIEVDQEWIRQYLAKADEKLSQTFAEV